MYIGTWAAANAGPGNGAAAARGGGGPRPAGGAVTAWGGDHTRLHAPGRSTLQPETGDRACTSPSCRRSAQPPGGSSTSHADSSCL